MPSHISSERDIALSWLSSAATEAAAKRKEDSGMKK
jgi:hypothetical protein